MGALSSSHAAPQWRKRYGPWALVTGASDGIGRALSEALAARGLHLVLAARRRAELQQVADACARTYGIEVQVVAVDVASPDATAALQDSTRDLDIGVVAACAGFGTSGPFLDADLERELEMLRVNCAAVLQLTHAFGPRLAARGKGGLILMSSVVAFQGVPRAANYAATKAFVQSFAEGLARELAPQGVDVLASAPGPVRSGFGERADMRMSVALTPAVVAEATLGALGRRVTVRPGWLSQVLAGALATAPRRLRVRILGQVMAGMTAHHRDRA